MDIEKLKQALNESGIGYVMSDEEFEAWWKESEAYQASAEGRAEAYAAEAMLDYYLDNVAKYKFTKDMDEISGFGGSYEKACRAMLDAGIQWLDAHPDATPKFKGNSKVYGLILEDNDDAKALSEAVVVPAQDDCTGAMHHAAISHCLYVRKNGWDAYVKAKEHLDD